MTCWGCVSKGLYEMHDLKPPCQFQKDVFVVPHDISQSYAVNKYIQKNSKHLSKQHLKSVIVVFPSETNTSRMNSNTKIIKRQFRGVHNITNVPWSFIRTTNTMGGAK